MPDWIRIFRPNNRRSFALLIRNVRSRTRHPPPFLPDPNLAPERDWSLTGAHNYIVDSHMVNELRIGWTGAHAASIPGMDATTIADQVGILPYLNQNLAGVNTNPNFKISGFQSTGGSYSSKSNTQTVQLLDNFTWTRGRHTFKFGGDYRNLTALFTDAFGFDFLGVYTFNNSVTSAIGNPYAAFLLGIPDSDTLARCIQPDTPRLCHELCALRSGRLESHVPADAKLRSAVGISSDVRRPPL